jgi:hypothetical protein
MRSGGAVDPPQGILQRDRMLSPQAKPREGVDRGVGFGHAPDRIAGNQPRRLPAQDLANLGGGRQRGIGDDAQRHAEPLQRGQRRAGIAVRVERRRVAGLQDRRQAGPLRRADRRDLGLHLRIILHIVTVRGGIGAEPFRRSPGELPGVELMEIRAAGARGRRQRLIVLRLRLDQRAI